MPLVTISKQFKLLEDDGATYVDFYPGPQHISVEHASHWYVKAHLSTTPDAVPQPGTPEYGAYLRRQHEAHLAMLADDDAVLVAARAESQRMREAEALIEMNKNHRVDAKRAVVREKLRKRA